MLFCYCQTGCTIMHVRQQQQQQHHQQPSRIILGALFAFIMISYLLMRLRNVDGARQHSAQHSFTQASRHSHNAFANVFCYVPHTHTQTHTYAHIFIFVNFIYLIFNIVTIFVEVNFVLTAILSKWMFS